MPDVFAFDDSPHQIKQRASPKSAKTGGTGVSPVWRLGLASKTSAHTGGTPMPPWSDIVDPALFRDAPDQTNVGKISFGKLEKSLNIRHL
jgi:hypothetical protein